MSSQLKPSFASKLTRDLYGITSEITFSDFIQAYQSDMALSSSNTVGGVTGGYVIKKRQTIAVFSTGKGKHKNEAFILFKGTSNLYDALTDLNAGIKTSHTGTPIHQGFYYAFDSVLHDLKKFIGELKGVSMIHCLGHSLGGALASLAADWIRARSSLPLKLYTFGSPGLGWTCSPESVHRA